MPPSHQREVTTRQLCSFLCCALLCAALAQACGDDGDGKQNLQTGDTTRADTASDDTLGGDDTGSDTTTASDTRRDTSSGDDTTTTPPDTSEPDLEEDVIVPTDDDFACDVVDRIAACEAALLHDGAPMPGDPAELLYYVNRWYSIASDYPISSTSTWLPCYGGDPGVPHDLICVPAQHSTKDNALRQLAWHSDAPPTPTTTHDGLSVGHEGKIGYQAMFDAAAAEAGYDLFVLSGFRSYATQEATFNGHVNREVSGGLSYDEAVLEASTYSAQPGHSEHQLGTTADLTFRKPDGAIYPGLGQSMANYDAMRWVHENSHRFGIVLTYDKDKIATTQYVYEPWHHRFVGVEAADEMRRCMLNTEEFLAERYGVGPLPTYEAEDRILYHHAELRSHENLPPGAWVTPGTAFTKTWRVKNGGTINWHHYTLSQVGGDDVFAATDRDVSCIRVGQTADLSLDLVAPTTKGTYEAVFRIVDPAGTPFGDDLLLRLVVDDMPPPADPYLFVRVDDVSDHAAGTDPGADLDAVVLRKADGAHVFVEAVEHYMASPQEPRANDPAELLGTPDAFYAWPDTSVCNVDTGFVSLGGSGTIIARMGAEIEAGDTVEVLELGGCSYGSGTAIVEEIEVLVSVSPEVGAQWIVLGRGTGPAVSFAVPELPPMSQ